MWLHSFVYKRLITLGIFLFFLLLSKVISIKLRHHFLCSPLFPFFPPQCLQLYGGDCFFHRKESVFRLHRQKGTQPLLQNGSLTRHCSNAERQVGVRFLLIKRIYRDLTEFNPFKLTFGVLQHLQIVEFIRKIRNAPSYLTICCTVLINMTEDKCYPQTLALIAVAKLSNPLFDVKWESSSQHTAAFASVSLQGAPPPLNLIYPNNQVSLFAHFRNY